MARAASSERRNRPAFYIDISVPRNVDPRVGEINNLFVFDIDDLEAVIASNIREREREAERAELIIESEVMQFQQALRSLDLGPTVAALRERLHEIAREEFKRLRPRLGALTSEQEKAVESLLASTVNKIAHPVITRLRRSHETGQDDNVQAWRDSFKLDE
jgi:glutamyl-tRNA reductase